MTDQPGDLARIRPDQAADALREDLRAEYYAIVDAVSGLDQRLLVVKGWSVTLSLVGLGLGFQQGHYALFALAALTALAFWFVDVMFKRFQLRYYSRMRDIEVAAYELNHVSLPTMGDASSPRIDMYWSFKGFADRGGTPDAGGPIGGDWRTDAPIRRTPEEIHAMLRLPWVMPQVFLPHAIAVVLGVLLFLGAVVEVPGLDHFQP